MYTCEFCGSVLSTEKTLKIHKETAKKCLSLRVVPVDEKETVCQSLQPIRLSNDRIDCQMCSKNVAKNQYKKHISRCKFFNEEKHVYKTGIVREKSTGEIVRRRDIMEITVEEYNRLKLKEVELDTLKLELDEYKTNHLINLQNIILEQKRELDRRTKTLEKKAFEPRNINYGVVMQQYLSKPIDLEGKGYKEIIDKKLSLNHVKRGEEGIADFVLDELLRDKETKEIYMVCCDEKKTLKYMKTDGVMVTDKGGKFFLQTMKKTLVPDVNLKISDLIDALPEEEKEKFHKFYSKFIVLGYAFSEHIATRTYISKTGGINPFRDQSEIKTITDAEAKFATKKVKNDKKDRKKLREMEEKFAEDETDEMKIMREQDRKIDEAREERKRKKNQEKASGVL